MRSSTILGVMLFVCGEWAFSQPPPLPSDTLAMVGRDPVTTRDLIERMEIMPFEGGIGDVGQETAKRRAVESIIGERLLSLSAADAVGREPWRMTTMRSVLERFFVRDALFQDEVRAKVQVTDAELSVALERSIRRRRILVAQFSDPAGAKALVRRWEEGRKKGSTHEELVRLLPAPRDTVTIGFGSVDQALEDAAYRLPDRSSMAGPVISTTFGPVAIVLIDEMPLAESATASLADRRRKVHSVLAERRENLRGREVTDGLLRGHSMRADSQLAGAIAERLLELILADSAARQVPGGFRPLPEDLYTMMRENEPSLSLAFVRGTFGEMSLGSFLESLLHYDFIVPSLRRRSFGVSFSQIVRALVEAEIIALEGLRRGLQHGPEVRRDVALWMGHWRSRWAEYAIAETVSVRPADGVFSWWRQHPALVESTCVLDVREILRPDSSSAASIRDAIRGGMSVDSLARQWTIREEWRTQGGRSGWFVAREHRDLASWVLDLEVGEWKGPVRTNEGYALVQLLGRKFAGDTTHVEAQLQREMRRVRLARQHAAVNRRVAELAAAQDIWIDYEGIRATSVTPVNMITRRFIGFGGRINAAPFLVPQWGWVEEWRLLREQLP